MKVKISFDFDTNKKEVTNLIVDEYTHSVEIKETEPMHLHTASVSLNTDVLKALGIDTIAVGNYDCRLVVLVNESDIFLVNPKIHNVHEKGSTISNKLTIGVRGSKNNSLKTYLSPEDNTLKWKFIEYGMIQIIK